MLFVKIFRLVFFTHLLFIISFSVRAKDHTLVDIENGFVDLSHHDFNTTFVELGGNVYFYQDSFIYAHKVSDALIEEAIQLSLSKSWDNQQINSLPTYGYGSYFFKMEIPDSLVGEVLVIRPKHFIAYASEVYVNNVLVSHNGAVGTAKEDGNYFPRRDTKSKSFIVDTTIVDVVIWVSNFNHFRGGIFNELQFGLEQSVLAHREKALLYDLIVIISLLIMFLYHFVLYFVNTNNSVSLFFSLMCLIFAIDFSFQDTMSFFLFFPNIGFSLGSLIHLCMPFLLPSSFIFFLYSLFPIETSKKVRNFTGLLTLVFVALVSIQNTALTASIVKPNLAYTFFVILYVYYVAFRAIKNKREGAVLFSVAYIVFSICAINDILFVFELIHTASLVSTGLMVFVFLLSILQGNLMVNMYNRNITLSENLQTLNTNLEQKVEERTEELNASLESLQKLNLFKEDMTNMMVHDLKAPLSTVLNVKYLNNEDGLNLVQQAGYKMLNLVQNILGVYKYEQTKISLSNKSTSLVSIIDSAIDEVKLMAEQKSVTIAVNRTMKCVINVDEDIIARVFVNLFSNAIKFSPKDGVINVVAIVKDHNIARISITNQGPAIPMEQQAKIFERFGQSEAKGVGGISSTGLGLTFCKMAIEAHHGSIGVISEPQEDVEFWFVLPKADCLNCGSCNLDTSGSFLLKLSASENNYLSSFIEELSACKIYEVSTINTILKKVTDDSDHVMSWKTQLEQAVYYGDSVEYSNLLGKTD